MTIRHLDGLFRPAAIAVIGASRDEGRSGGMILRRLRAGGFAGPVLAVNRRAATVQGQPAWADVESLPQVPDLAVLATAPGELPGLVRALCRRGCRAFAVLPRDGDAPGMATEAQDATLAAARPWLGRLLGPDSFGVMVPALRLNATLAVDLPAPGHLACVTASTAVAATLLHRAQASGIGISKLVGAGAAADIDLADLVDYLSLDADTHVIALHLQAVPNGRKFMSALRAASRLKPVIVCRSGNAGDTDAWTDAVHDAVFRRAGALRVADLDDLFDAAIALAAPHRPRGSRLAIAGNGGGLATMTADAAAGAGLQPLGDIIDIGDHARPARHVEALARLGARPGTDALLLAHAPSGMVPTGDIVRTILAAPGAGPIWTAICLPAASAGERRALGAVGYAAFADPLAAVRGLGLALRHRQLQDLVQRVPGHVAESGRDSTRPLGGGDGRGLLADYGIRHLPAGVAAGLWCDPVFGPAVWVAPGPGPARSFGLPPLDPVLAADLCRDVAADGLPDLLVTLGRIAIDHPEIREMVVDAAGDAAGLRCRVAIHGGPAPPMPAIRPYPAELAGMVALRDGTAIALRPVRPDDAPLVDDLFEHLTPDDVHTRFFSTLRVLPRALRARLTQIDYDREMAFVAIEETGGDPCLVGMIHLLADPDFDVAEFAVMVRSDWQGRGVGHLLMRTILSHARRRGLRRIVGVVLNENRRMLDLARRLGFAAVHGRDPGTSELQLDLEPLSPGPGPAPA